jgi:hypothetical protein
VNRRADQFRDVVLVDFFPLDQRFGNRIEFVAFAAQNFLGSFRGGGQNAADFLVDQSASCAR